MAFLKKLGKAAKTLAKGATKTLAKVAASPIGKLGLTAVGSLVGGPVGGGVAAVIAKKLGDGKVQSMLSAVKKTGAVNVNSVKQTLAKANIATDTKNVDALVKGLQTAVKAETGKTLPTVSELTKTQAKEMLPQLSAMKKAVANTGAISKEKIAETLKQNGLEAASKTVNDVAKIIDRSLPNIETPIVDKIDEQTGEPKNDTPWGWIIGGIVGVITVVIAIFKFKK